MLRWNNENCLRLYTQVELDGLIAKIQNRAGLTNEERAAAVRSITGNAEPIEPDKQGRFVIPTKWVSDLGMKEEVAFFGAHTRIEIWPANLRREMEREEQAKNAETAPKIQDLML